MLTAALGAVEDPLVGTWLTSDGSARVRVSADASGAGFVGAIQWLASPLDDHGQPRVDEHNPDTGARTAPIIGLRIVSGLQRAGDDYAGGMVYDPKSGKSYHCKASLTDGGSRLHLRGYIGVSLFGRTEVWSRVMEAPVREAADEHQP